MKALLEKIKESLKTNVHKTSFWVSIVSFVLYIGIQILSQVYNIDLAKQQDGVIFFIVQLVLIALSAFGVITNHDVSQSDVSSEVKKDAEFVDNVISTIEGLNSQVNILKDAVESKTASKSNAVSSAVASEPASASASASAVTSASTSEVIK